MNLWDFNPSDNETKINLPQIPICPRDPLAIWSTPVKSKMGQGWLYKILLVKNFSNRPQGLENSRIKQKCVICETKLFYS